MILEGTFVACMCKRTKDQRSLWEMDWDLRGRDESIVGGSEGGNNVGQSQIPMNNSRKQEGGECG